MVIRRDTIYCSLTMCWASLVVQMVKNLPAMWETRVRSPGQEDLWRMEWLPTLVFLPGESHWERSLAGCSPWGHQELDVTECVHAHTCTHTYTHTYTCTVIKDRQTCFTPGLSEVCVWVLHPDPTSFWSPGRHRSLLELPDSAHREVASWASRRALPSCPAAPLPPWLRA